jgi:HTH-type transcriptional regulator/antitoxin MqsA
MMPKFCAECGAKKLTKFKNESVPLHNGTLVKGLSGWRCAECGEIDLDDASLERFGEAGDAAILAEREEEQKLLIRVRKKLKLTQHQAAQLTGGGHNAFGRYERGEVQPMAAVVNLFKLLDKHPGLLKEIQ